MRITIDTDLQVIIVPNSYYDYVDRLNEIITEAGGDELDYKSYIKTLFEKAYETKIIRADDVKKVKGTGTKKRKNASQGEDKEDAKTDDKPAQTVEGEKK